MSEQAVVYYENYSPVGDLLVVGFAVVIFILIMTTFLTQNKNFYILLAMLGFVVVAALSNVTFHVFLEMFDTIPRGIIYGLRDLYHIALFATFHCYIYYAVEMLELRGGIRRHFMMVSSCGLLSVCVMDVFGSIFGYGFLIKDDGEIVRGLNFFPLAYCVFVAILVYLLLRYRKLIVPQIIYGILFTLAFCLLFMAIQGAHDQMSFTTATFLFPILAMLFLMHSNPYELDTGAVNETAFDHMIQETVRNKRELILISLNLIDFRKAMFSAEMRFQAYHFFRKYIKGGTLFRIAGGRLVLVFRKDRNPSYEKKIKKLIEDFLVLHGQFKQDYKAVIMESSKELNENNDYLKLIRYAETHMMINSHYRVTPKDMVRFGKHQFILRQLEDIARKMDLNDKRVLPYCQPVYNVKKEKYDTAEALMRLELPELGMVFPDSFIPIAEESGCIHVLSLIILNKTCQLMHQFLRENLYIRRISINISMRELREENFCQDILHIIEANDVPYDHIAIEFTESQNETDFQLVKSSIDTLRAYGIKIYLDDFGTGYSNFERIMELPFDIIKFDRSLVMESSKNRASEFMVNTFADMFRKLDYRVLYEGVEDDMDEERCIQMYAQYLQGYKYSKPIAMERLRDFLSLVDAQEKNR